MFFWWGKNEVEQAVEQAARRVLNDHASEVKEAFDGYQTIIALKKQITDLEITHAKKKEEWDRREREVEHKIGLERKRQEFEIEQSKREATVAVQQSNLNADKERFKGEMEFQRKHLESEITGLRDLVNNLLERLPDAKIIARVTDRVSDRTVQRNK